MPRAVAGKIILITGANSGIGFEAARMLARDGATVLLACRNADKGETARAAITRESPAADVELVELDLADLESIRTAAKQVSQSHSRLDILINNAGVMAVPRRLTADGFELHIGTNHLGHFALTGLLLDQLLAGDNARVVTISSGAHKAGRINFDDLHGERWYFPWTAYAQSKLANLLFTFELACRSAAAGTGLVAVAAHPGWSATNLQSSGPRMRGNAIMQRLADVANLLVAQPAQAGAECTIYAATAPHIAPGDYIGPDGILEMRGRPKRVQARPSAHNQATARRLWETSERLTGVTYSALA